MVPLVQWFEHHTLHHPLLLLLLLNTTKDGSKYKEVVSKLCFYMPVDLFDSVEMLDIVLDEKEHNYGIQKGLGAGMIVSAWLASVYCPPHGKW